MPFATINGLRLFYHEQGDPALPSVLFVHGTQGNASLWADAIDALSDRFHCLALNHRGCAPSDAPDDPSAYSIELFADDLAAFIEQRELSSVSLVGWSLGVRTSLSYLQRHGQERARSLITVGGPPSPRFGGRPLQPPNRERTAEPHRWGETFGPITEACWQGSQASRASCDLEWFLPQLAIPVAVFHGREDPIAPFAAAEAMASAIPGAVLNPFEASGHAPLYTEPQKFLADAAAFLAGTAVG